MDVNHFANQVVDRCDSTNRLARLLGDAGYPHGTWVSTRVQEMGRGRLGRKWESLEGNLFLSMIFQSSDQSRWSWVPMITAVGVTDALLKWNPKLDVRIKWPNDLWLMQGSGSGAKLGGILCEAVGNRQRSYIIVGLGLNCLHAPSGLDQRTISLTEGVAHSLGYPVSADAVRGKIIQGLLQAYEELLLPGGFQSLITRYQERAALLPQTEIEWVQVRGATSSVKTGRVLGLGESGELLVCSNQPEDRGATLALYAEDVKIRPKSSPN